MDEIKENPLDTVVDRVDVSRDGARVFRSGKIDLVKGSQKLRITGLTKMLMKDSVRLSGRGTGTLGAIDVETRYHEEVSHDALKDLKRQDAALRKELGVLQGEVVFCNTSEGSVGFSGHPVCIGVSDLVCIRGYQSFGVDGVP